MEQPEKILCAICASQQRESYRIESEPNSRATRQSGENYFRK
jgi:hypothetical protein